MVRIKYGLVSQRDVAAIFQPHTRFPLSSLRQPPELKHGTRALNYIATIRYYCSSIIVELISLRSVLYLVKGNSLVAQVPLLLGMTGSSKKCPILKEQKQRDTTAAGTLHPLRLGK